MTHSGATGPSRTTPEPTAENDPCWVPAWVRRLGVPVWVSGPQGRIRFLNQAAEELLELSAPECLRQHCFRVVGSRDESGLPFCGPRCPVRCQVEREREMRPVTLQVGGRNGRGRWIQLLSIPVWSPDGKGPCLVECALDADRAHRAEEYLTKVASRSTPTSRQDPSARRSELTRREKEILRHLANDEDLPTIAASLFVSHATIRNHVQHVLAKLGVHSVSEAVALHLLETDG